MGEPFLFIYADIIFAPIKWRVSHFIGFKLFVGSLYV